MIIAARIDSVQDRFNEEVIDMILRIVSMRTIIVNDAISDQEIRQVLKKKISSLEKNNLKAITNLANGLKGNLGFVESSPYGGVKIDIGEILQGHIADYSKIIKELITKLATLIRDNTTPLHKLEREFTDGLIIVKSHSRVDGVFHHVKYMI